MQPKSFSLLASLATLILFVITTSEKCPPDKYQCPADPIAEIDPAHAQFSPVAQKIFLQLLKSDSCKEKGNVKLFAQYAVNDYSKDSLAFLHEGKKLVLRDDGIFPDVTKDDQEYTAILQFDTAQLRRIYSAAFTEMSRTLSVKGKGSQLSFINFNGREVVNTVSVSQAGQLQSFDFDNFVKGKKTEIALTFPSMEDVRNNSLYIIDPKVVEDPTRTLIHGNASSNPNGAWTFKKIMEGMANTAATGISAEDFTLQWLQNWKNGGTVNGDVITPRNGNMDILINNWPRVDGKLDLTKSPFKLIAIVNRLDLMPNPVYSTQNEGGEMRFVFSILRPGTGSAFGSEVMIFEFGVSKSGQALIDYARQWYVLKDIPVGSADYNTRLEAITNDIIKLNAVPSKPNGSSINQVRTNELNFGGWQLREFVIDNASHTLKSTTIKQEPSDRFNNPSDAASLVLIKKYIDDNEKGIEKNRYKVPDNLSAGVAFLGSKSNYPNDGVWANHAGGAANSNTARFVFSINTCSGCHKRETDAPFLHNQVTGSGSLSQLSGFIKGSNPGLGTNDKHHESNDFRTGEKHTFNDLARRAKILWGFMNSHPTLFGLQYNPVNMEH